MPTNEKVEKRLDNLVEQAKKTSRSVNVSLVIPSGHYDIIKKIADLLQCTPETVLQKALNHALKGNTLGHVVESMLGEKYHDVFNNNHSLDLS